MPLDPTTHQMLLATIPEATARGRRALENWDAVSDSLCDDNHEPLDERYDIRQHQRDTEAWDAFTPFLDHGPELLAHAEEDFRTLHADVEHPDFETIARRRSQLTELHGAIEGGRRVRDASEFAREMVLTDHPSGEETLRRLEVLRNAEGWHYAITWADNADVLVEIDQAARAHPTAGRARTAQAQAARARTATAAIPNPVPAATEQSTPQQPRPGRSPRSR